MTLPQAAISARDMEGSWLRLRTLISLRWMAIFGQATAITVAYQTYNMDLDLGLCFVAVGAAVMANLLAIALFPQNTRLSERAATVILAFDVSQLAVLLMLTGGLNNPFALLILAPATIAATALQTRATVLLGGLTIALVTLVAFAHLPLRTQAGVEIAVPALFGFGFWLAVVIGVVFQGFYARRVAMEMQAMGDALLATQMALAREQKLTDLGGVVAAAAHELGTPLATIMLTSRELINDLTDRPDLRDDADLISRQADRCRDILRGMGRAGKEDLHLRTAPLTAVIREAAEPHSARGKALHFASQPGPGGGATQPKIFRQPEIIHGLRNLIQNAVDFAEANAWVDATWTKDRIVVRITDDGAGFPQPYLGRIGDPFLRGKRGGFGSPGL